MAGEEDSRPAEAQSPDDLVRLSPSMTLIRDGINCTTEDSHPPYARFGFPKWPFVSGSSQFLGRDRLSRERIGSSKFQLCHYLDGVQR